MRWTQSLLMLARGKGRRGSSRAGIRWLLQADVIYKLGSGLFGLGVLGVELLEVVANWLHAKTSSHPPSTYLTPYPFDFNAIKSPSSALPHPISWYIPAFLKAAKRAIRSHKQLPKHLVTLGPVYRHESRTRAELFRAYAFHVIEAISLANHLVDAYEAQRLWMQTWEDLFERTQLKTICVRRQDRLGTPGWAYVWPDTRADTGFVHCPVCDTWLDPDIAPFAHRPPDNDTPQPLQRVFTPDATTVSTLCTQLDIEPARVAKSIFLVAGERVPIIAVVRGDMELSWGKLKRIIGTVDIRRASSDEIEAVGGVAGYGSAIGVRGALIIVDAEVMLTSNLVAGANQVNYHFLNVNPGRDFQPHIIADIARAPSGSKCPHCHSQYTTVQAWCLASVTSPLHPPQPLLIPAPDFMPALGELPPAFPMLTYLDKQGKQQSPWLVRAAMGVERLIAAVAEDHHDEDGLKWPVRFSPVDVQLVAIFGRIGDDVARIANYLYEQMEEAHFRVLYDDRDESAGVKLKDADLIGAPIRVVVSPRTLKRECAELKTRDGAPQLVPLDTVVDVVAQILRPPR